MDFKINKKTAPTFVEGSLFYLVPPPDPPPKDPPPPPILEEPPLPAERALS